MNEYWDLNKFISKKADLYNYINPFFDEKYLESHNFFYMLNALKNFDRYFDNIYFNVDSNIKLDIEQRKAIIIDPLSELIIAGAGSGKTTTISAKIKYLVEILKIKPSNILLLSYTNEAVNEMKRIINDGFKINAKILTFHKIALLLLNKKIELHDKIKYEDIIKNYSFLQKIKLGLYLYIFSDIDFIEIINKSKKFYQKFYEFEDACNKLYFEKQTLTRTIRAFVFKCVSKDYIKNIPSNIYTFDSIINEALNVPVYTQHYDYVFVDEFQDISNMRFDFLKRYVTKEKSKLVCVGDDWQTIFSFASSNIGKILNFSSISSNTKIVKITNTYRNSQELINLAGEFVMKNDFQIKKKLKSFKRQDNPLVLCEYKKKKEISSIVINILESFPITKKIAIIGRYKRDVDYLDNRFLVDDHVIKYQNRTLYFYTIHASKGLGFDEVILINNMKGKYGFPTTQKNSSLFVENDEINEERRLFYVALTRTKNKVFLIYPYRKYSNFIKEIKKMLKKK